jgi:hypothetical protein
MLSPLPGRNPSHSKPEEEEENFEGRGDSLRKNKGYYHRLLGGRDQGLERERELGSPGEN